MARNVNVPRHFRGIFLSSQVVGLLCVLFVLIWLLCYRGGFGWRSQVRKEFNLHPLFMSFGFIYLSANSLLIYRGFRFLKKQYLKALHVGIHVLVLGCVALALVAVIDAHNYAVPSIPNFYSAHSWLGLLTIILYLVQFVVGFLMYSYPGVDYNLRIRGIHWHIFFGLVIFIFANITAFSGFQAKIMLNLGSQYKYLPGEAVFVNIIALLHLVFCVLVVYLIVHVPYQRRPSPEDGVSVNAYPLGIFCTRNC